MGFSTQMAFQNFHPLPELECPPGFAQISSDPKNLHFIDLAQLQDHTVQEEVYSFKRQELSQGVAGKGLMKQDKEKFNEMVESFFAEYREARRKTPVHDDHEVAAVHPNILQKTSTGKGKKNQSVKGSGRSIYTWTNRQNGRHRIWERIDRMMANEVWRSRFSDCRVLHEVATSSDHKFLILKLIQDRVNVRWPFRFEIMWAQHGGCQEQVQDAFQHQLRGSPSFVLCKKLQNCQKILRLWNKHVFGEVEHKLEVVKQRLSEIQSLIENAVGTEELFLVENDLILEHNDILVQQAIHWGQKACLD
ncbi:hypothetical protein IFM89_024502 [Coptis chinensis]|uniref:Uncharacterized protein n=1 Tax=Coptis chinensis TaxID=261450 RepID=A0A835H7F2_9MAGN|nr:hypothetical protein IFM89_024502 [Coptis chinensis]